MPEVTAPEDALDQVSHSTEIGEVFTALMAEFGGPLGFAHAMKMVFDDAPKGSATRARIAVAMLGGLQRHDSSEEPDDDKESIEAMERQLRGGPHD